MEAANYVVVPVMGVTAAVCAATAWRAQGRRRAGAGIQEPALWGALGAVFVLFVVMKLDRVAAGIQSMGREEAKAGGMYGQRHLFQLMVVTGIGLVGALLALWLTRHVKKRWERYRWTLLGTAMIVCFGLMRMVSLHEIDALGGTLMIAKGVVETGAAGLAAWGALRRMRELRVAGDSGVRRMEAA